MRLSPGWRVCCWWMVGLMLLVGGESVGKERGGHSRHGDMEGAPGNVLVSPFDHQGVAAFLL